MQDTRNLDQHSQVMSLTAPTTTPAATTEPAWRSTPKVSGPRSRHLGRPQQYFLVAGLATVVALLTVWGVRSLQTATGTGPATVRHGSAVRVGGDAGEDRQGATSAPRAGGDVSEDRPAHGSGPGVRVVLNGDMSADVPGGSVYTSQVPSARQVGGDLGAYKPGGSVYTSQVPRTTSRAYSTWGSKLSTWTPDA